MVRTGDRILFDAHLQINEFGETEAVLFIVREGKPSKTIEVKEGVVYADYDSKGRLLAVELLAPCTVNLLDRIARKEPEKTRRSVRKFLKDNVPRAMVQA